MTDPRHPEQPPADTLDDLFALNRTWAENATRKTPGFFTSLLDQQTPQHLWIGCADSRVPANELVGLQPGELFVHRNVANVVAHGDLNCLSVVQFATDVLKVRHIMVVGHSRCGGVLAALEGRRVGLADNWLRYVRDVRDRHADWIASIDPEQRWDALCELNVIEQARHVCETTVVTDAWARGQKLAVHGLFYRLHNGLLKDLRMTVASLDEVEAAYTTALGHVHGRYEAGTR